MKKLILAAVATTCAVSVFAQGTIVFNNRVAGSVISHVYWSPPGSPLTQGSGATDLPVGSTTFPGNYILIGTAGTPAGSNYLSQLLGAPGFNAPESSLLPAAGIASFRSGGGAGNVAGVTATFQNVGQNAAAATVEMVAWDNTSGLYPTWTQASVAWAAGLIAAGESGRWNQDAIGGTSPAPNLINTTDPTQHVQSFNIAIVPEPASAALLGLGAAAMLIFRRRK
jgi:hypothetical protein